MRVSSYSFSLSLSVSSLSVCLSSPSLCIPLSVSLSLSFSCYLYSSFFTLLYGSPFPSLFQLCRCHGLPFLSSPLLIVCFPFYLSLSCSFSPFLFLLLSLSLALSLGRFFSLLFLCYFTKYKKGSKLKVTCIAFKLIPVFHSTFLPSDITHLSITDLIFYCTCARFDMVRRNYSSVNSLTWRNDTVHRNNWGGKTVVVGFWVIEVYAREQIYILELYKLSTTFQKLYQGQITIEMCILQKCMSENVIP